jgi:hypothetical protein
MNLLDLKRKLRGPAYCPQGKGGGSSAPAPDPNIGLAQQKMADLSQKEFDYYQNTLAPQYQAQADKAAAQIDDQNSTLKGIADQYQTSQKQFDSQSQDYYDMYKGTYMPAMQGMVDQANAYDTEGNYAQQAQLAVGDVNDTFNAQQQSQARQMQSVGVDPTSGAYSSMWNANGVNQAAQQAAAASRARVAAQQLGWNMKTTATSMGQNLPGASLGAGTAANQALAGATGATQQTVANNQTALGNTQTGIQNATQQSQNQIATQQSIGGMAQQSYNTQVNAWQAQQQADAQSSAGIGSAVGGLAMAGAVL